MKKTLKSQITMLMIIGLLLFIVVGLVLYLSKLAIKKQSTQTVKKVQGTAIETHPIRDFVAKCLDKLAKDAVVLLGKQGGRIYTKQGGTNIDFDEFDEGRFFVRYDDFNVAYNIVPPSFAEPLDSLSDSSEIPYYPWKIFPYKDNSLDDAKVKFEGYFGKDNMPPLEATQGAHSIQTQIERFVDNNMANCLDFNVFEEQGLGIEMKKPNTSVIIGRSDISVNSKFPITISNPLTKESTELNEFSTKINVRLKDIYFFADALIQNDIKNIKFNITSPENNRDDFNIRLIKNMYSSEAIKTKADLVIITDYNSLIEGKPFEYVFARKNRAPALYYIKDNEIYKTPDNNNYITIKREDLLTNPRADDPDEDNYDFKIFIGDSNQKAIFSFTTNVKETKFKVETNDGMLSDYQFITVYRR